MFLEDAVQEGWYFLQIRGTKLRGRFASLTFIESCEIGGVFEAQSKRDFAYTFVGMHQAHRCVAR